jgi:betaine-aldehyde dehydrogenase
MICHDNLDELITEVASASAEDINIAVAAAKACLYSDSWGFKSTGAQRAVILRKMGQIIESRKDELAKLDSLDQGKPLREALADMNDAVTAANYFADLAEEQDKKQYEEIDNGTNGDFKTKILLEPIGVIAAITPW